MHQPAILISGAGIAGSTLAFLLARRGFRVTLVERARGLRSSGTPVDVQDAAFDVAAEMGVVPKLRDAATQVRRMVLVDGRGRRVSELGLPVNGSRQIEVPRSDLARILCEAARGDAELLFDDSIADLRQDEGGVDVTFERAAPRRFDFVIGCDGLHSTVRRFLFGPERAFIDDLGMYVATFPLDGPADDPHEIVMYNVPDKAISIHPGRGQGIAALMVRRPVVADFDHRDTAQHRRLLVADFHGAGWRSDELLRRLDEVDDFYFDSVSRVRLDTWSKGRVALLGDAASCVSFLGGGSSNAMAGAAVLARALGEASSDYETAFRRYEHEHRRRVDPKVKGVGYVSHLLIPSTRAGIAVRNLGARLWSTLTKSRDAGARADAGVVG
ncbi:monooxygenase, FAD-binding protein [Minicystis rosea]|nr:monooxygenase, FAD-binding protein [Minicystis rosea]